MNTERTKRLGYKHKVFFTYFLILLRKKQKMKKNGKNTKIYFRLYPSLDNPPNCSETCKNLLTFVQHVEYAHPLYIL